MTPLFWIAVLYMVYMFGEDPMLTLIVACTMWTCWIMGI